MALALIVFAPTSARQTDRQTDKQTDRQTCSDFKNFNAGSLRMTLGVMLRRQKKSHKQFYIQDMY